MIDYASKIDRLTAEQQERLIESLPPLSYGQERIWFLEQLDPGGSTFNVPRAVRLVGKLDVGALQQALTEIVRRHEMLRTSFLTVDALPYQIVHPAAELPLSVEDLSGHDDEARHARSLRRIHELAAVPFQLDREWPIRAALLVLGPEQHVLVLVVHHIAADGWSLTIFDREISALYQAFRAGQPSPLPELSLQYADFAKWHRKTLEPHQSDQLDYWKSQLADHPADLDLPTDWPQTATQTHDGASVRTDLSPALTASLAELSKQHGCTLYMVLLAGASTLLARHTGSMDICIGCPVAGRETEDVENLIGFFLNTIVMRLDLSGNPTFEELLRQARKVALGGFANQSVPFEKLLEELQPKRQLNRTPLFQVMLNLQSYESADVEIPGLRLEPMQLPEPDAKCDLTFYGKTFQDSLRLSLVYNTRQFERETALELLTHLERILTQVAANPSCRLSDLRLLASADTQPPRARRPGDQPEIDFGRSSIAYRTDDTVTTRFERIAALQPQALAIDSARDRWTYDALNRLANRIARTLDGHRSAPQSLVALVFAGRPPAIASMLGALKAGMCYLCCDPAGPGPQLNATSGKARITACVTDCLSSSEADRMFGETTAWIHVDYLPADVEDRNLERVVDEDRWAYILHTSGSMGAPKGVVQSRRNLLHHIRTYAESLQIGPGDRLTLLPSLGFDAAVMDIYGALLSGARLCPFDLLEESADAITQRMGDQGVTIYHSTPTVFRFLFENARREDLATIRAVVLGGEEARGDDLERFRRLTPTEAVLVNGFGPSESTLALQFFATHADEVPYLSLPIGQPVAGTRVTLVDDARQESEVFGEISLHGEHLALGYWNDPDATSAAFVESGESNTHQRTYYTGDMARRRPDGTYQFRGRKDRRVKIGGLQADLVEVEASVREVPEITDCFATIAGQSIGEIRLIAYFTSRRSAAVSTEELRKYLRTRLPSHMVPTTFVPVVAIPFDSRGKVDVSALPPAQADADEPVGLVEPRSPLERLLAALWSRLLGLKRVGITDDFFAVGGTSLLAVQLFARLRSDHAIELPLRAIFDTPTIAGLAQVIEGNHVEPDVNDLPVPSKGDKDILQLLNEFEN